MPEQKHFAGQSQTTLNYYPNIFQTEYEYPIYDDLKLEYIKYLHAVTANTDVKKLSIKSPPVY